MRDAKWKKTWKFFKKTFKNSKIHPFLITKSFKKPKRISQKNCKTDVTKKLKNSENCKINVLNCRDLMIPLQKVIESCRQKIKSIKLNFRSRKNKRQFKLMKMKKQKILLKQWEI